MPELKKLVQDGNVAVIVSPDYGAGWSTWNSEYGNQILFDPEIAAALIAEDKSRARQIADDKYPDVYAGGLDKAIVKWVPQGQRFVINEYDGYESLEILGPDYGHVA